MEIIHKNDRSRFIAQDEARVIEIASPRNSMAKNLSFAEVVIYPGHSVLAHYHKQSEELFYILQGKGQFYAAGKQCLVDEGDTIIIPAGEKHQVVNGSDENLIMLVVGSPAYRDEDQVIIDKRQLNSSEGS